MSTIEDNSFNNWRLFKPINESHKSEVLLDFAMEKHHCPKGEKQIEIWALDKPSRHQVFKLQCRNCNKTVLVKLFNPADGEGSAEKLFHNESQSLEHFRSNVRNTYELKAPRLVKISKFPWPMLALSYEFEPSLLEEINTAINNNDYAELFRAISVLGLGLANWHNQGEVEKSKTNNYPCLQLAPILKKFPTKLLENELLTNLEEAWFRWTKILLNSPEILKWTVVHEDLNPKNLLWCLKENRFILLDFELTQIDHPMVDIGTIAAEFKYCFHTHAWNAILAEPAIGNFLRNYYAKQNLLKISYAQFTYFQRFFMARRLLIIGAGLGEGEPAMHWCINEALNILGTDQEHSQIEHNSVHVRGICFDFYNTLVQIHTEEDHDCFNAAREAIKQTSHFNLGQTFQDTNILRSEYEIELSACLDSSIGNGMEIRLQEIWITIMSRMLSRNNLVAEDAELFNLAKAAMIAFRKRSIREFSIESDAIDTLSELKKRGIKLCIISNAQSLYFENDICGTGLSELMDAIVVSERIGLAKPNPEIFRIALARINLHPADLLFVGDDLYTDIHGATQAGLASCLKLPRYKSIAYKDTKPDWVIKSLSELLTFTIKAD